MMNKGRNAMRSVKIEKLELVKVLKTNLTKHIKEFKEAEKDYKKVVIQVASDNLKLARTGNLDKVDKQMRNPPRPESHEDDYRRALRMLELSMDTAIELEDDIFNQLVLDEWHWKQSFEHSNFLYKSYSNSAVGSSRGNR